MVNYSLMSEYAVIFLIGRQSIMPITIFTPVSITAKGIEPLIADIIRYFKNQLFVGTECCNIFGKSVCIVMRGQRIFQVCAYLQRGKMNEEKLLRALADGSKKALERIMKKYSGYVCTVARNFSHGVLSEEDIDEISVEVFYKLWNVRHNLDAGPGLSAYLSAAARNAVKNRFRDLPPPYEDITELELPSDDLSVEDKAEFSAMTECLNEGVELLSPKEREIFLRFYLYGEKSSHIAEAMNISEGSVRTSLHRTRAKLKKFMSERGYDHV